jgi:hypothetical protein
LTHTAPGRPAAPCSGIFVGGWGTRQAWGASWVASGAFHMPAVTTLAASRFGPRDRRSHPDSSIERHARINFLRLLPAQWRLGACGKRLRKIPEPRHC